MEKNLSVVDRFIRYAKIDTQSDPHSESSPSSKKQFDLARLLKKELEDINCLDVKVSSTGYVSAHLAANGNADLPSIGFIAHMDTSPDFSGEGINPRIVKSYDGKIIHLNKELDIKLDPLDFPELIAYKGQDLIVTDGTTLLGADDKAGIAEIIEAMAFIQSHPEIRHGPLHVCFTPDEEIGRGADHFDITSFDSDFAFTLDGGPIGELEFENFNAAAAIVNIQGRSVHPGTAKDRLINAQQVAIDFHNLLPGNERPEHTDNYEGFFHLIRLDGKVDKATMEYIIRDHDKNRFGERKNQLIRITDLLNKKYPGGTVKLRLEDQYYNMREKIESEMHIIDLARKAITAAGIKPVIKPIRGGTDGAKLSYMGLPTPNLFTGGHNFHGQFEFIPISSMVMAIEVIINIIRFAAL